MHRRLRRGFFDILSDDNSDRGSILEEARLVAAKIRNRLSVDLNNISNKAKSTALGRKRYANTISRKIIIRAKRGLMTDYELKNSMQAICYSKMNRSILLDGLCPDRKGKWNNLATRASKRKKRVINVKNFTFILKPNETIRTLAEIAKHEIDCISVDINFNDEKCLDIGALLVLTSMKSEMLPVFCGGRISNSMSKVFVALRLDQALGITVNPNWDEEKDIWAFPLHQRRESGSSQSLNMFLDPQESEKVGDSLCDEISEWLGECASQTLTREGRRSVKVIVGEILDNAERHSRPDIPNDATWMVSGMMVKRNEDNCDKFNCQLAFLSIGSSISDTIETAPGKIKKEMIDYVNSHKHSKNLNSNQHNTEHLQTIYALQPSVTCNEESYTKNLGGSGFSDIIGLFLELSGTNGMQNDSTLTIISGQTCINIKHQYCDKTPSHLAKPTNIWFNEANDRSDPPNSDCIVELDERLSGTLITMNFTMDPDYLERNLHEN